MSAVGILYLCVDNFCVLLLYMFVPELLTLLYTTFSAYFLRFCSCRQSLPALFIFAFSWYVLQIIYQDRQCTNNVILRCIYATTVEVDKQFSIT